MMKRAKQQGKQSWLHDWPGWKRRPSKDMCFPMNPSFSGNQHGRKPQASLICTGSSFTNMKFNNGSWERKKLISRQHSLCKPCHQNRLWKPTERAISALPRVFHLHFIKLVFWLNGLHSDEFHKEKRMENVSWILHPGVSNHPLMKIKASKRFLPGKLNKSAPSWVFFFFHCHSCEKVSL